MAFVDLCRSTREYLDGTTGKEGQRVNYEGTGRVLKRDVSKEVRD